MLHKRTHFKQFAPQEDQILPAAKTRTMKTRHILIIALALLCGAKASAQEWVYAMEQVAYDSPRTKEAKPLRNGNIAVTFNSKSPSSSFGSFLPGLLLLSPDGELLARNDFPKPAFWGYHNRLLQDVDGTTYMVAAYSPDHDSTCANFFLNFDNPPDYAILGLYKLDEQLAIVESHEFQVPVDTVDSPDYDQTFGSHNEFCGSIYVFSAFIDDGAVVGGYFKKPSFDYYHPHGYDSVFFFRIGLDGTLLNHVGYEMGTSEPGGGGLNFSIQFPGYYIVKTGDSYVCFLNTSFMAGYGRETEADKNEYPGHAYFLDKDFNILDMKHYHQRNGLNFNYFKYSSFVGSRHNTVYLSSDYYKTTGGTGCSLYEYGLGDDKTETLPILRYIERTQSGVDEVAYINGVALASDNSLYFAYAFRDGVDGLTIEHLTPDFDTISTMYYTFSKDIEEGIFGYVQCIEVNDEDDLLMTFWTLNREGSRKWYAVAKFPAEAFVGIEEAHAHGLKVAVAYPNPGKGVLNIRTGLKNARVEVYDMGGRLMHSQPLKGSVTPINAEDWPSGVYVWKIIANGIEAESGKWVKN